MKAESAAFPWPDFVVPPKVGDDPASAHGRARTRYLLRLAALIATEAGTMSDLSEIVGLSRGTLPGYARFGEPLNADLAQRISDVTGKRIPAWWFRPDVRF